ncbi:CRISPR-associated helicase Cas3 [Leptospira noguchii str. 1993005606]|uniref:CRISPR-associated helicase Cas3 n=2 Tax=Leptospira noguchii TaxID=28182 RepID=M6YAN7_9LEPT|nr:CRISPR-associated helicase/endonuclease Cas3 [Leptospira noguchii]EMN02654.1 CRISPR-associated helicase Cas3 [Leptospira noguchii str. 2007001578]EMO88906.1 CRISPR-associated helicase Cas3 [Leptospira noguchii str. 2001034031]EPE82200.1 CRISPR-associated helicase Cas3 [Leptospira noguchii str. 1993005606]
MSDGYYNYWGKAGIDESYHLLVYHSLDVAAVGEVIFQKNPSLLYKFSNLLKIEPALFRKIFLFFLAIHDLGKFSNAFQGQIKSVYEKLNPGTIPKPYSIRHDSLGFMLWNKHFLINQRGKLSGRFVDSNLFYLNSDQNRDIKDFLNIFISITTGHHGKPPSNTGYTGNSVDLSSHFTTQNIDDSYQFLLNVYNFFLTDSEIKQLEDFSLKESIVNLRLFSFWLAGLSVLCDWIGSNKEIFKFNSIVEDLQSYWNQFAIPRAFEAVYKSGILPSKVTDYSKPIELFPYLSTPTPLQAACDSLDLADGPQLFILEDVTGAGKTEAALILAKKLMNSNGYTGMFIGLPTMATANGMYDRISSFYRRIYEPEATPSLILAHGGRNLSDTFRQSIISDTIPKDRSYAQDEESASAQCTAWLADSSKKATLSDIAVGTIDQVLISILLSKFQSLRLFGLLDKILILDEIHAYDEYMNELIQNLLSSQAKIGNSVILLSATIPHSLKEKFISAFNETEKQNEPKSLNKHYPLLTQCSPKGIKEFKITTREEVKRSIPVNFIYEKSAIHSLIQNSIQDGKCVCWIRNTVTDALEAFEVMRDLFPEGQVILFHARFAMGDRLDIEQKVKDYFGPNSNHEQRKGKIVISTQVVEQSLDLDFDVMISDLAPIDLLIQRAGRLHRHTRDQLGNRIQNKDTRENLTFHIYSPVIEGEPQTNWYSSFSKGGSVVYPDHGKLFLTAKILKQKGELKMPEDARNLIEYVYGDREPIPINLLDRNRKNTEKQKQNASRANNNVINLQSGYTAVDNEAIWNDLNAPTRLGEETVRVILAKYENGVLAPWYNVEPFPWPNSEVKVLSYFLKSEKENPELEAEIRKCKEQLPDKGKHSILIPLIKNSNNQWIGTALDKEGNDVQCIYDSKFGFRKIKSGVVV